MLFQILSGSYVGVILLYRGSSLLEVLCDKEDSVCRTSLVYNRAETHPPIFSSLYFWSCIFKHIHDILVLQIFSARLVPCWNLCFLPIPIFLPWVPPCSCLLPCTKGNTSHSNGFRIYSYLYVDWLGLLDELQGPVPSLGKILYHI